MKPALESGVCLLKTEYAGKTYFVPNLHACPSPPSFSEAQKELAATMRETLASYPYRTNRLFTRALQETPQGEEREATLLASYRGLLLSDPTMRRALMPKVELILAKAGLQCPECPGPHVAPASERVTVGQLLPYAAAFLWPARLMPGNGSDFMVCVGMNGMSRIAQPDSLVTEAAFACVNKNGDAMEMGEAGLPSGARGQDAPRRSRLRGAHPQAGGGEAPALRPRLCRLRRLAGKGRRRSVRPPAGEVK